jgi:hypothetical protein
MFKYTHTNARVHGCARCAKSMVPLKYLENKTLEFCYIIYIYDSHNYSAYKSIKVELWKETIVYYRYFTLRQNVPE